MKLLYLRGSSDLLSEYLRGEGDKVISTDKRVDLGFIKEAGVEFIISYGYRYIIKKDILGEFSNRAINLHISYLPWNRGADPNFWSFIEGTPKGVTIHYLDEGVDTGDIIIQKRVEFSGGETLAESYYLLQSELQGLFKSNWGVIKGCKCGRVKQPCGGSYHRARDKECLRFLLYAGWDTPVEILEKFGKWADLRN